MDRDEMVDPLQRVQTAILSVTDIEHVGHVVWATFGALAEMMAITNKTTQASALIELSAMAATMHDMLPLEGDETVNKDLHLSHQ